jgi:hypothetical protein
MAKSPKEIEVRYGKIEVRYGKIIGKYGKIIGKYGKNIEKTWENLRKIMEKSTTNWGLNGKTHRTKLPIWKCSSKPCFIWG